MSALQKARAYDNARKSRNNKTGSTRSRFGDVGRKIDAESEKPRLQMHKFVSGPKSTEEQRSGEVSSTREELDKVKQDEEKEVDKADFHSKESKPVVRSVPRVTNNDEITSHKAAGVFSKAWTISDHVVVPEVIQPKMSYYLPNFISATVVIQAFEHILDGVEEMKWIAPFYFSLPARLYWSVLFYIQILKAREAARKLTKSESTWFRAFKRIYPLESLPVIGPLVPFYTNIVSVKPNDDMYDFIYPEYVTNLGVRVEKGRPIVGNSYFIQPNILLTAEFLRTYVNLTSANLDERIQVGTQPGGERYFNDRGDFIPHRIGEAFTFAGVDFPAQLDVACSSLLSGVSLDKSIPEGKDRLKTILRHWNRSKLTGIPAPTASEPYDSIGSAMRMIDDFEWFEDCIEMATIQCKYFSDSINMSQIPATGGSEALIGAHITGRHKKYEPADGWYPDHWSNLCSQFRTTRADTTYEQFFNAGYALTTATISWESNGHPIGGRQVAHRGGPYWDNRLFQYVLDHDIEVMRRVQTMVRSLFFDSKGKAVD